MAARVWSPSLPALQRQILHDTRPFVERTLCFYCIEGAYCARHWPLNIPHMDDNNNNKRSDLQNNSTADSVKRLLGILRRQSELEKSENGICSGLPKPLSTAASESDPSVEPSSDSDATIPCNSLPTTSVVEPETNVRKPEVEEVYVLPREPKKQSDGPRRKYQRFREKKFTCEHCGHSFTLKHNMHTHIAIYHTGEGKELRRRGKRYKCLRCGELCRTMNEVQRHHRKTHEIKEKSKHTCDLCQKDFRSQSQLSEHHTIVHLHERPYECTICAASFGRKSGLRRHKIMKHSDFVYKCPYEECTHAGFKCSKALTAHIRSIHTHVRPYKCEQCEKTFVRRNDLRTHEALHSASFDYVCDVCGQRFKRSTYMKRHSKVRHKEVYGKAEQ
ncbi:Zinc finger protein [Toxocara canis]|uniref:Zinc finger protein n=1 Tax=Toxocara canis TaxID=6265 RepID=A0A0B2VZF6_TOXCA|nr:Zinc finger protein [Toxocara canis]